MPNNFDVISDRFYDQYIKTNKVLCQEQVQDEAVNEEILIPAGGLAIPGVGTLDVDNERQFTLDRTPVTLFMRPSQTANPRLDLNSVAPNKAINAGAVFVNLFAENAARTKTLLLENIPLQWQVMTACHGAEYGDFAQKHDFQFLPFADVGLRTTFAGENFLILKAVIHYCLVVAGERVLKVNAAERFC